MNKVLVTPRSLTKDGDPALDRLREAGYEVILFTTGKQPSEDELISLLPGCVGYLAGVEKVSSRVLEAGKNLRVISRNGTGADNIDKDAANRMNIRICRTEGTNSEGVAELTIGLILALVRSIPFSDAHLKDRRWERKRGIELEHRTLGLIGCGEIGKRVALLATGMGMEVIAFRRNPDYAFSPDNFRYVSLEALYQQSDVISLQCPALDSGEAMIDKEAISKMKKGVYLINTARASLMDQDAVLQGVESGHIAGVAIDVFDQEPPTDYRLVIDPRVIATPHIGGYTSESISRTTIQAVENIITALEEK